MDGLFRMDLEHLHTPAVGVAEIWVGSALASNRCELEAQLLRFK